jgi:hypothetical protein
LPEAKAKRLPEQMVLYLICIGDSSIVDSYSPLFSRVYNWTDHSTSDLHLLTVPKLYFNNRRK